MQDRECLSQASLSFADVAEPTASLISKRQHAAMNQPDRLCSYGAAPKYGKPKELSLIQMTGAKIALIKLSL